MIKKTIVIDVDADEANKALNEVTENVEDVEKAVKSTEEQIEETTKKTSKLKKGLDGAAKAGRAVGTALKAAGIGLIIALFAKLSEILSKNQKVMDFFSKTMITLETAFKDLFSFVSDNFMPAMERVRDFFSNLTFKDVGEAIKNNLIERFQSLLEVFGHVGDAIRALIRRDWDAMKEAAKAAGKEFVDVATGVDNSADKITETFTKAAESVKNYASETWNAAEAMTELNNQAQLAEAINRGILEQYDRQAEQLRQLRDDSNREIEDRIAANEKLGEVLNEQEQLMLRNAELTIQAAQNQLALNNNIENQVALQEALNEKAAIQAQIEGFRSEQLMNQTSLLRERAEIENQYYEDIEALMDADLERFEKNEKDATETSEEFTKQRLKTEEAAEASKVAFASNTSNLIGQIVDNDSKLAKGVAVAQAIISGFESVQNAFTTAQKSPITAINPSYPFIQAGLAGAFSALQLAKIRSADPTGRSNAGGGGQTGGRVAAPSFNLVRGTGTNQIAEGLDRQEPIAKAYVVSSDVSSGQELDRKIIEGASL